MVPGHGPGTRKKCFALSATKSTSAEEPRLDGLALAAVDGGALAGVLEDSRAAGAHEHPAAGD